MPILTHLSIFPIKSLDGIAVTQAKILPSGALEHDREFALFDSNGKVVNGKRTAEIHRLRSHVNLADWTITISVQGNHPTTFHLDDNRTELEHWLSDYFSFPINLRQNREVGFPDDLISPGPTVISTATLQTVASWFPTVDGPEMRQRLRTNLELDHTPAFWEDCLYTASGQPQPFHIGDVTLQGINPCQRCIVPTRDSLTGTPTPNYQKQFIAQRQATLPADVARSRFNHFYRLAVNTRIPPTEAGKMLQLGDQAHL